MQLNKIYNLDFLNNNLKDKSVNLIIADPPYFETKGNFDFIWTSFDDYLADVEKWATECKRILKDNGALFWWGNSKKIAYSQIILDRFFKLENSLIWEKCDSIQYQYYSPDNARVFNTHNERLLYYSNEKGQTGLEMVLQNYVNPLNPFAAWINKAKEDAGLAWSDLSAAIYAGGNYKNERSAGAQISNFKLGKNNPIFEDFLLIGRLCYPYKESEQLRQEYEQLRQEYEQLRQEYEQQRRAFYNPLKITEVLKYNQAAHLSKKFNHPTQKTFKMSLDLIKATTRAGDVVCVPFAGSGTECAAAARLKLDFIGFDIEAAHVETATNRVKTIFKTPTLF